MTAQELKNSILQLAIQGKLVKQNPNDESASVLLEKIREEREKLIKDKKIKKEKYSEIYKESLDNHYYEKFEDGTIKDITEEIPFEISNSWRFIRFKNLINYKIGKTPARDVKQFWNKDYNWVSISDMKDGKTIKETKEKISKEAYDTIFNKNITPKGTLLMSFKLTIGKVSILEMDSFHNEAIISIYPYYDRENILRDYLFKIMPLISNYGNTKNAIKGKTLNSKSINNLLIPIASLDELNRITKKIIALEPVIEAYNKKNIKLEALNNNYKEELKKSIVQYAIQGKLVEQNFKDELAETLINRILEEKRELIKNKKIKKENLSVIYKDNEDKQYYENFDDGKIINITNEIPFEIPYNWCWTKLKNIVSILGDGLHGTPEFCDNGDYYFINGNNLENGKIVLKNNTKRVNKVEYEKYKKTLTKKTMFVSINGTIGNIAFYNDEKVVLGKSACYFNLLNCDLKGYLYYFFKTDYFLKYAILKATGSTIKNVSLKVMRDTLIPIPPLEEQSRITNKIEKIFKTL